MSIHDNKVPIYESFNDYYLNKELDDQTQFKNSTDGLIFQFLAKNNSGKTRDQICKGLNLARSSVYDSLNRLNLTNLIEIDFKIKSKSKKGRPSTIYYLKNVKQGKNR